MQNNNFHYIQMPKTVVKFLNCYFGANEKRLRPATIKLEPLKNKKFKKV